jgi:hypothetical protein
MMHTLILILAILLALVSPASVAAVFPVIPLYDGSIGYQAGELVKFNGTVFICNTSCTQGVSPADPGGQFWNAMSGANQWNSGTNYQENDMAMRAGTLYSAVLRSGPATVGAKNPPSSPTYWVAAKGTNTPVISVSGNTGADIQAAIDAAPPGGIVQLACGAYFNVAVSITKALTLQGCGTGGMQTNPDAGGGTRLNGQSGQNVITVNTQYGVVIRDMVLVVSPAVTGLIITTPGATPNEGNINDRSIVERVWFLGGTYGIYTADGRVRALMVSHSYFRNQTVAGFRGGGVAHTVCNFTPPNPQPPYPDCPAGTHIDNCDGGGYTLSDNLFEGDLNLGPADALFFSNSAAVTATGNQIIGWGRDAMSFTQSCFPGGPAPTQFQIVGNQIEAGVGRSAIRVEGQHATWMIGDNYISGSSGPAVYFNSSGGSMFSLNLTGNMLRIMLLNPSTQPSVQMNNVQGLSITGNSFVLGQSGTAPNAALLTNIAMASITGNNVGLGGVVVNGFNVSCTTGTSCVCAAGNTFNITGTKFPSAPATGGC